LQYFYRVYGEDDLYMVRHHTISYIEFESNDIGCVSICFSNDIVYFIKFRSVLCIYVLFLCSCNSVMVHVASVVPYCYFLILWFI